MYNVVFFDTSALINLDEQEMSKLLAKGTKIGISDITLVELDKLKQNKNKDSSVQAGARSAIRAIRAHKKDINIVNWKDVEEANNYNWVGEEFSYIPDCNIIACCLQFFDTWKDEDRLVDRFIFYTNDYNAENLFYSLIENKFVNKLVVCETFFPKKEKYLGFKEVQLSDEEMAQLYQEPRVNRYNLKTNEYLIVRNSLGEIVDKRYWDGEELQEIQFHPFISDQIGVTKPIDDYQSLAFDSMIRNQMTLLTGKPGCGKSHLAVSFLFSRLEKRAIDKIIIFCNTVPAKDAAHLGLYPGSKDEKLLDSQIGNFLSSKLGDRVAVEQLMKDGKLVLLPMSDIRGFDTTNMNAGIYITEAQNTSVNLMKLCLQRIGEDSIVAIDGDFSTQVDEQEFEGNNNGLRRLIEVFAGFEDFGMVDLQIIHRSRIAAIADKM